MSHRIKGYQMTNLDGCEITFPIVGRILGVGRLATKLKALADTKQIGPWHIGHPERSFDE